MALVVGVAGAQLYTRLLPRPIGAACKRAHGIQGGGKQDRQSTEGLRVFRRALQIAETLYKKGGRSGHQLAGQVVSDVFSSVTIQILPDNLR